MDGVFVLTMLAMLFPKTFAKHCALIVITCKKAIKEGVK